MKKLITAGMVASALLVADCGGGGYGNVTGQADTTTFNGNPGGSTPPTQKAKSTALYQVFAGVLPYPFDVYFANSTDGTLNIQPQNSLWPAQSALNGLDGFSTTAPIREIFNGPLDTSSLGTPGAVVVVHISTNNAGPQAKAPVSPLQGGTFVPLAGCVKGGATCTAANYDYMVGQAAENPAILEITPLKPLAASSCLPTPPATTSPCAAANGGNGEGYLVLLTKAITVGGTAAVPDADYASFQAALASGGGKCPSITDAQLNAICQLTGAHLALGQALGINPADVVASFSFSTQSILDTLAAAASEARPQPISVNPVILGGMQQTTAAFQGLGLADVYVGVLTLPYYLSKSDPDTGYWQAAAASAPDKSSTYTTRFNPFPVANVKALQVPVLMTVPNSASGATKPSSGWPIVIFQHGLGEDRTNLFGIADSLAKGGFVGIAIDLPLHGLTIPFNPADASTYLYAIGSNPLYANLGLPTASSIERTFDLNTINMAAGLPGLDPSGSHYVNLASLLTYRDNLRESSVDLVTVAESVGTITLPAPATAPYINPANVHYVGHSQGAIIGGGFLAVMPTQAVLTATLANPGGEFIYLGAESPTYGPVFIPGLEKASGGLLTPGTTPFALFERDAQTVVDSGDPWNFIALATALHPIHMIEVVGTTPPPAGCNPQTPPNGCPDQVVPNDATDRLIAAGGFTQASPPGVPLGTTPLHKVVKFTAGVHASFLDPTASLAATVEMQTEAVAFALADGLALPVTPGAPVQ
jgi:pimeloyl-ACP methyl ester carboxylesterase